MTRVFEVMTAGGRLYEWISSVLLASLAISLALPGDALNSARGVHELYKVVGSDAALAVPVAVLAAIRFTALLINGQLPYATHPLRQWCAVLAAALYLAFAGLLAFPTLTSHTIAWSTAVTVFVVLAAGDLVSAWRAGVDAGLSRRR